LRLLVVLYARGDVLRRIATYYDILRRAYRRIDAQERRRIAAVPALAVRA